MKVIKFLGYFALILLLSVSVVSILIPFEGGFCWIKLIYPIIILPVSITGIVVIIKSINE